jgi:hypothetical protein
MNKKREKRNKVAVSFSENSAKLSGVDASIVLRSQESTKVKFSTAALR